VDLVGIRRQVGLSVNLMIDIEKSIALLGENAAIFILEKKPFLILSLASLRSLPYRFVLGR